MRLYILLFFFLCSSCKQETLPHPKDSKVNITTFEGLAMTIPYRIEVGKKLSVRDQNEALKHVERTFHEINEIYNKWNPLSELSLLNKMPAFEKRVISEQLYHFLERCDKFVKISKGRFDPTIETLQALWKNSLENNSIPSDQSIEEIRPAIGWNNIVLEDQTFMKKNSLTALDLGGIVKGYTVDLLIERLQKLGYNDVFVEWGGEVKAIGKHPQGRNWAVYISNLEDLDPEHALAYVPLVNQAIATSGDYLQQWVLFDDNDKKTTYFHVFDPDTLKPLKTTTNSIASASVLAEDCTTSDALATMLLMAENLDEAKTLADQLQEQFPNTSYWLMSRKEES